MAEQIQMRIEIVHIDGDSTATPITNRPVYVSSAVAQFVSEHCEVGQSFRTGIGDLYTALVQWCRRHKLAYPSIAVFGKEIRAAISGELRRHRDDSHYFYRGIRLKEYEPLAGMFKAPVCSDSAGICS